MVAQSIGQAIPSSAKMALSSATERLGNAHIAPITWQKTNRNTSVTYPVATRGIMGPTTLLIQADIDGFCSNSLY